MSLINAKGERLYLTAGEREAFLKTAKAQIREVRAFCTVIHDTGCRISEALALKPSNIDFNNQTIIFETLKKRHKGVFRAVPVPSPTLDTLSITYGLVGASKAQQKIISAKPFWSWSRKTGYRKIIEVMKQAGIEEGAHRTPKGLRHGYGVHAISCNIPLNLLSQWMGHSSLDVTAIYANAQGEEAKNIAARMWS